MENLRSEADFTYRRWKKIWWSNQRAIMKILAQHDSTYASEESDGQYEIIARKPPV